MNTSPTTTTCPLAKESGTEMVSPTGSELTSISLDVEQANDDASASAVDASPKAKTMKDVLLRYGRGLAVAVVIALAGKGFVARAHTHPPGTDGMMMNADLGIDSSKQVALLELEGDGKNVAGYDLTKVDGGVSTVTVRTLEQVQNPISYTFTKVVDRGVCLDSNNNQFDSINYSGITDVGSCMAKCEECPGQGQAAGRELRGITYLFILSSRNCFCLLDDGAMFSASACLRSGIAVGATTSQLGTGAICNVLSNTYAECWKVVDSNLQCPTPAPAPTNDPTSSPSMSPTQSPSTAPTAPPSVAPTASPTAPPSMAPTASPSKAPTASPTAPPTESPSTAPKHLHQLLQQHLRLHLRQRLRQHLRLHLRQRLRQHLQQHLRLHLRQWLRLNLPQRAQQHLRLHSLPRPQQMQTPKQVKLRKRMDSRLTSARDEIRWIFCFHLSSCWYFGFDCGVKKLIPSSLGL